MKSDFEVVSRVIKSRRTVKPAKMNGKIIPDNQVQQLLELADWAPTHKHTEPWRFVVYTASKAKEFVLSHAELYRRSTPEDIYSNDKYEKILANGNNVSHMIICYLKRDPEKRVPEIEEISASAAAIENILLAAESLEIAGFWSTGGMTHTDEMKQYLGLDNEDKIMGIIYLGYTDFTYEGKRTIPLEQKINRK